jgi:hypothetical protein
LCFSSNLITDQPIDREEAKREDNFDFSNEYEEEEDEEWEQEADWNTEADETEDAKDESAAYLEFLNEEVRCSRLHIFAYADRLQAQKFSSVDDEDDDELEEESLLETPLDKVEPYSMFKHALLSKLYMAYQQGSSLTIIRPTTRATRPLRESHKKP